MGDPQDDSLFLDEADLAELERLAGTPEERGEDPRPDENAEIARALYAWAVEHGLPAESVPTDTLEAMDAVVGWAKKNGCQGGTFQEVTVWAQGRGFGEDSYTEVLAAFERTAGLIRYDKAENAAIGDEAKVDYATFGDTLSAVEHANAVQELVTLIEDPSALSAMLLGDDADDREDAVGLIARAMHGIVAVAQVTSRLRPQQKQILAALAGEARRVPRSAVSSPAFARGLTALAQDLGGLDPAAAAQAVLSVAFKDVLDDLFRATQKASFTHSLARKVREEQLRAREALGSARETLDPPFRPLELDSKINIDPLTGRVEPCVKEEAAKQLTSRPVLKAYVKRVDENLRQARQNAQSANRELWAALQRNQSLVGVMARLSPELMESCASILS